MHTRTHPHRHPTQLLAVMQAILALEGCTLFLGAAAYVARLMKHVSGWGAGGWLAGACRG